MALAFPTLSYKVTAPACWLKSQGILWGLPTHPPSNYHGQTFSGPRFQNGSLTPCNSHRPLHLPFPSEWHRHTASSHLAHRIGQITLPGRLCFVTPELSTIPKACASRYRPNPLSLISPDMVSHTLRSAGVGHRFNSLLLPPVGIHDGHPSPDPL